MGKFIIELTDLAKKHLQLHKKAGHKTTIKKIDSILAALAEHPKSGVGKPEALKYDLSGNWSRRINQKDRLIYSIDDEKKVITVVSAHGHYIKR